MWREMSCELAWQMPWGHDGCVTAPDVTDDDGRLQDLPGTPASMNSRKVQDASWCKKPRSPESFPAHISASHLGNLCISLHSIKQTNCLIKKVFSRKFLRIESNEKLLTVFSVKRMLIITYSLTAAINNAINKMSQVLSVLLIFLSCGYVKIIENFLLKTKFLRVCFRMMVSWLPSYETTHTERGVWFIMCGQIQFTKIFHQTIMDRTQYLLCLGNCSHSSGKTGNDN